MNSISKYALLSCATVLVSGCAAQQHASPEYRLSSSAQTAEPGASMLQRGRAQLDVGLDALAIESFRAEIRINPESADAYNGLAVAYGRIGRGDLAQRYFETALAKDPSNVKAQANLSLLTGNDVPRLRLAEVASPSASVEPVAVTASIEADPIGGILDRFEMPAMAVSVRIPQIERNETAPTYALAKQGILSTRFAVAPARFATVSITPEPAEPPALPDPSLPPAHLPADYRASGTRLVRVSLGEVHLITRTEPPVRSASRQTEFKSFGDRLAVWLPQSIAAEQRGIKRGMHEDTVLMAAIERAELADKLAKADDVVMPELPEFAYLFFATGDDAASI